MVKTPALEDSAIQAGSQPAAVGFAPGNALLFVLYFDMGLYFILITHVSFFGFSSFWFVLICLSGLLCLVHQTGVLQHDLQSWSREKGNVCVQCMWGALQVLELFRHLCQPPLSDPRVLHLPWSAGRRKPDGFGAHIQGTVLTYLDTCKRKTEACQANSWFSQDLLNSILCAGGLVCQTASLQAKRNINLLLFFWSNPTTKVEFLPWHFMLGHATSSHSSAGMEGYFKHIKRKKL